MPATALKAADKQAIMKKLVTEMKRRYGGSVPKHNYSTFETVMFAACLEDTAQNDAEVAYARLLEAFFDLNEIRVSSVTEIETVLGDSENAAWKAMRIREALQHTFEKYYAFDLEFLKRKTQEQAVKELNEIPYQTPFIRNYVIQHSLGAHVLPVDQATADLLAWLGLADSAADPEHAGEDLKSSVKKSDGPQVCHLLHSVATDPELREHFEDGAEEEELDPFDAPKRLAELFKNPKKKKKKTPAKKTVSRKKPAKKASTSSRSTKKTSKPGNAKKTSSKKVTKKVPARKKTTRKRSN